jgi:hypothetical protein
MSVTIKERLNNPGVIRVFRHMIENSPLDVVLELRKNIKEQAGDHPKVSVLEEFFVARLGK